MTSAKTPNPLLPDSTQLTEAEFLEVCRLSPNAFTEFAGGLVQADVHKRVQHHLTTHHECYCELHRCIGKTTQMSYRLAWEIGNNPNVRIKYVQQTDEEAVKTTKLIKEIIESDEYRKVFPHIKPNKSRWGSEQFQVERDLKGRDATVEAKGVFGRAGGRADILVADDICDLRNAVQQSALREQVKEAWANNWRPMLTRDAKPREWKVGTCYHVSDITADWRERHEKDSSLLRMPVVNYVSPWDTAFTTDVLRAEREAMGPIAFARAFELVPVSSEQIIFDSSWLDSAFYTELAPDTLNTGTRIATVDFAFTEKASNKSRGKGDPDYSVCIFGIRDGRGHVWVQDMIRVRSTFPDFSRQIIEYGARHEIDTMYAEANGPQAGLVQQLNDTAPFPVLGVNRSKDKITRASECQSFVESKRLHLRAERDGSGMMKPVASLRPLYDEMTTFPACEHDDTVDAVIDLMQKSHQSKPPTTPNRIMPETKAGMGKLSKLYG
jgi:predicted phage terminase large subunit-like protein